MESTISVVRAFNGENRQIRKYGEKLDDVQKACNTAGIKIGVIKGAREDAGEWQGSGGRDERLS